MHLMWLYTPMVNYEYDACDRGVEAFFFCKKVFYRIRELLTVTLVLPFEKREGEGCVTEI